MKTDFSCGYTLTKVPKFTDSRSGRRRPDIYGETVIGTGRLTDLYYFMQKNEDREPDGASSRTDHDYWAGASWEDAFNSPLNGYPEIMSELKRKFDFGQLSSNAKRKVKSKVLDTSGAWVMPLVMQGSVPLAAIGSRKIESRTQKTITIYYSSALSCGYSAAEGVEAGTNIARLCWSLEQQGYKVRLVCGMFTARTGSQKVAKSYCLSYEVKDYNSRLNPINLSVACHVATFRRLGFRAYELIAGDESNNDFDDDVYGYPIKDAAEIQLRIKSVFPDAVVITAKEAMEGDEYLKKIVAERCKK